MLNLKTGKTLFFAYPLARLYTVGNGKPQNIYNTRKSCPQRFSRDARDRNFYFVVSVPTGIFWPRQVSTFFKTRYSLKYKHFIIAFWANYVLLLTRNPVLIGQFWAPGPSFRVIKVLVISIFTDVLENRFLDRILKFASLRFWNTHNDVECRWRNFNTPPHFPKKDCYVVFSRFSGYLLITFEPLSLQTWD